MSKSDSVKDDHLCNNCCDFTFGFNNIKFSDRVLVIETQSQSSDLHSAENGIESSHGDDSSCSQECSRVTKLHVNSIVLAGKSPFFYNLFSNGMMESEQKCVTLKIHASEENAVMELLNYMYSGSLTVTTAPALLDVLNLADKLQVASCMRLCTNLLKKLPMSTESAVLYLTSSLPMADDVQLLAGEAKKFLAVQYKDIDKARDEIMDLPLVGIEAILSSDVLQVSSEDKLFDFALKWAETHYPNVEDQRRILLENLGQYIRFPYMSLEKLREVLSCNILDNDFAHKAVVDALFFKIKTPHHQHNSKEAASTNYRPRAYSAMPIKVHEFGFPREELVLCLAPTFEQCVMLKPSGPLFSETFSFGGKTLYSYARCFESNGWSRLSIGLGFDMYHSVPLALDYEFYAWSKCSKTFVLKSKGVLDFRGGGQLALYTTPSGSGSISSFDFIGEILYLEVKIRIKK